MTKKPAIMVLFILLVLTLVGCGGIDDLFDNKENNGVQPSTKMVDLETFYNLAEDEGILVANLAELPQRAKKIGDLWYISINSATALNDKFYWNADEEQMLVTTADSVDYYWPDAKNCTVNGENQVAAEPPVTYVAGELYLSLDIFKKYTPCEVEIFTAPDRVVIWTEAVKIPTGNVTVADSPVRTGADVRSDILVKAAKDDVVYVTGVEAAGFIPVMTGNGFCGYISKDNIKTGGEKSFESLADRKESYSHNLLSDAYFTAVWQNMEYSANGELISDSLSGTEGVDVIIPTWYSVIDTDGNISSNANRSYVEKAHALGMEVWGLVDDFEAGVPGFEVLSSTSARNNLADSLVDSAVEYGIDGINVDFEYITAESAPHYIQFLRELYLKLKPLGLKLSVCNYVPNSGNSFYNLEAQAEVADYIMLMTYDEHYSPETGTGSVASYGFVDNGIKAALEFVPANRMTMGIPFYTRLWENHPDGTVTMQVLTMESAQNTVEHYGITPVWDEECGQYYVSYVNDEGLYCEMWLEETESIAKKRELCEKYGLAGTASWCLGYELDGVWEELK